MYPSSRGYILGLSLLSLTCIGEDPYFTDTDAVAPSFEPLAGAGDTPDEVYAEPERYDAEPETITMPTPEELSGEPTDPNSDLSAYTRWLLENDERAPSTAVSLARMGVSEAGFAGAIHDIPAILQVARNRAGKGEPLSEVLPALSPHVAQIKDFTVTRQFWTSTLPAEGDEVGRGWIECTSSYLDGFGRKRGLPKGCTGVWEIVRERWTDIRKFAAEALRADNTPVPGVPLTWGGKMDLARFLGNHPHMCLLSLPDSFHNYFFGRRDEPKNTCVDVTDELLKESRQLLARIREHRQNNQLTVRAIDVMRSSNRSMSVP
jgi:hypothetical protein